MPAASDRSRSVRRIPPCQQHVALAKVDAGGADMPSRPRGLGDGDAAAIDHGIFLDHDGVGAVGDHAAGKDPHRLAGAKRLVERPAGRDLADHLEPRRRRPRHRPSAPHSRPSPTSPAAAGCATPRRRAPARGERPHRARPFPRATARRPRERLQARRQPASGPRRVSSIRPAGPGGRDRRVPSNGEHARRQKAWRWVGEKNRTLRRLLTSGAGDAPVRPGGSRRNRPAFRPDR